MSSRISTQANSRRIVHGALIAVILATLPCYALGILFLVYEAGPVSPSTLTPTATYPPSVTVTPLPGATGGVPSAPTTTAPPGPAPMLTSTSSPTPTGTASPTPTSTPASPTATMIPLYTPSPTRPPR